MRAICRVAMCLALVVVEAVPYLGWGPGGRRIVGAIAQRFLTPEASAAVFQLLDGDSLADVSTWPDEVKAERGEGEYHYINVPRTAKAVDLMRDGKGGRTVLGATAEQAAILAARLSSKKPPTSPVTDLAFTSGAGSKGPRSNDAIRDGGDHGGPNHFLVPDPGRRSELVFVCSFWWRWRPGGRLGRR